MPELVEKRTGRSWYVPERKLAAALASGFYEARNESGTVTVVDPSSGATVDVSADGAQDYKRNYGAREESLREFAGREDAARINRETSGIVEGAKTFTESALDAASLGGYGAATDAIFGEDYTESRRERNQGRPGIATAGTIAGLVAPALLTGGAGAVGSIARAAPVSVASRLGARIAATGAERGLAGQLVRSAAGYGVEGAIYGAGEGVQELSMSRDAATIDRIVSTLSSKALYGGAFGGAIGAAGKAAEIGLARGRKMIAAAAEKAGEVRKNESAIRDMAGMDKAELKRLRGDAHYDDGLRAVEMADEIKSPSDLFALSITSKERGVLAGSARKLDRKILNGRITAKRAYSLEEDLYLREDVIRTTLTDSNARMAKLDALDAELDDRIGAAVAEYTEPVNIKGRDSALWGDLRGQKTVKSGSYLDKSDLEEFSALLRSGAAREARVAALERLPVQLEKNMRLQEHLKKMALSEMPRVQEIDAALEALKGGGTPGLKTRLAQAGAFGVVTGATSFLGPLAPVVGAAVASSITDLAISRTAKAGASAAARSSSALEAFLGVAKKRSRYTVPLASHTLASVSYGAPEPEHGKSSIGKGGAMFESYSARAHELRSITFRDDSGATKMRQSARREVAERLSAVRAADPLVADKMETIAARRVEFLASKLPRRAAPTTLQIGPRTWRPSNMAMRQFARYAAAAEDPGGVEERLVDGLVSPEDAEAMQAVYPDMLADLKARIAAAAPQLRESLPYHRRLALSILSGIAVDPAMDPRILRVLQGGFSEEPGTAGGTQAPLAKARFGTITRPKPTSSQDHAAG